PARLDRNDRRARAEELPHVRGGGSSPGVEGDARAVARNEVVAQAIGVDRPDERLAVTGHPGLESLDPAVLAHVKQHAGGSRTLTAPAGGRPIAPVASP